MNKLGLGALFSFLLFVIPAGCSPTSVTVTDKTPIVRVRILESQQQVMVAANAPPLLQSSSEKSSHRLDFPHGMAVPVELVAGGGWRVGTATIPAGELTIQPQYAGSVSVNGSAYHGRYRFVPVAANRFDVINDVDIDSYLASVVRGELPENWHLEAYRAQAIVARTYALYETKAAGSGKHFDLADDQRSQVYNGIASETNKSRQAVNDTAGVVVAYGPKGQERIFKAYFSSCCGGEGQSAYDAFGDPDIPPLRPSVVGKLCSASSRFNWGPIVIRKDELTRRIRIWGARHQPPLPQKDMGMLVKIDIAPGALRPQQRPVRFLLTDSRGLQYSMSGEELRWACNADANGGPTLNSSFVKPLATPDSIQFTEGHGWGHGVGMCQWCAEARAEQGVRHEQIVMLSYPGAVLVRAY